MGAAFVMVLLAPFMFAAWAAPFVARSFAELAVIVGLVWVPMLALFAVLNNYVTHEYWVLTWWGFLVMLSLPLLYAFSVGAVGQFFALTLARRDSSQEASLRLASLLVMAGLPVCYFLLRG